VPILFCSVQFAAWFASVCHCTTQRQWFDSPGTYLKRPVCGWAVQWSFALIMQTLFGSGEPETPQADAPKLSLLERLKQGIQKTRAGLVDRIEDTLQG